MSKLLRPPQNLCSVGYQRIIVFLWLLTLVAFTALSTGTASANSVDLNCDYSQAHLNEGWGWNPVTNESCEPLNGGTDTDTDTGSGSADTGDTVTGSTGTTGVGGGDYGIGVCPPGWPEDTTGTCTYRLAYDGDEEGSFESSDPNTAITCENEANSSTCTREAMTERPDTRSVINPDTNVVYPNDNMLKVKPKETFEEGMRDRGGFRTRCMVSHFSYSDPLVYRNPVTAMANNAHLHMYFGNTSTDANSTAESLLLDANSRSTCGDLGQHNRSAYWTPALLNIHDQVVIPDQISVYYKTLKDGSAYTDANNDDYADELVDMRPIPNGLEMISSDGKVSIVKRDEGGVTNRYLVMRVEFLNCLKLSNGSPIEQTFGVSGQAQHKANFEMNKHTAVTGQKSCRASQNYARIPTLEFNIQWLVGPDDGRGESSNDLAAGGWKFSNGITWNDLETVAREQNRIGPEASLETNEAWGFELAPESPRIHGDYIAAWAGNNDTFDASWTPGTDAMSQLVKANQKPHSWTFHNEFERLKFIKRNNATGTTLADNGGKHAIDKVMTALNNAPCMIGGTSDCRMGPMS